MNGGDWVVCNEGEPWYNTDTVSTCSNSLLCPSGLTMYKVIGNVPLRLARPTHYPPSSSLATEKGPSVFINARLQSPSYVSAPTGMGTHLLDVVDADQNALSALVQYGQLLGELSLVDGGRGHGAGAMHRAASPAALSGIPNLRKTSRREISPPILKGSVVYGVYK